MFPTQPQRPGPGAVPAPSMAAGGGSPPPAQGGAPASPTGGGAPGGGPMQVPPQFANKIDPNNPVQMLLMQRVDKLTPQDLQVMNTTPPQVVQVLKKVIPEVGFLLDMIGKPDGGDQMPPSGLPPAPGGGAPGGAPPQAAGGSPPAPSGGLPRPGTRLSGM